MLLLLPWPKPICNLVAPPNLCPPGELLESPSQVFVLILLWRLPLLCWSSILFCHLDSPCSFTHTLLWRILFSVRSSHHFRTSLSFSIPSVIGCFQGPTAAQKYLSVQPAFAPTPWKKFRGDETTKVSKLLEAAAPGSMFFCFGEFSHRSDIRKSNAKKCIKGFWGQKWSICGTACSSKYRKWSCACEHQCGAVLPLVYLMPLCLLSFLRLSFVGLEFKPQVSALAWLGLQTYWQWARGLDLWFCLTICLTILPFCGNSAISFSIYHRLSTQGPILDFEILCVLSQGEGFVLDQILCVHSQCKWVQASFFPLLEAGHVADILYPRRDIIRDTFGMRCACLTWVVTTDLTILALMMWENWFQEVIEMVLLRVLDMEGCAYLVHPLYMLDFMEQSLNASCQIMFVSLDEDLPKVQYAIEARVFVFQQFIRFQTEILWLLCSNLNLVAITFT